MSTIGLAVRMSGGHALRGGAFLVDRKAWLGTARSITDEEFERGWDRWDRRDKDPICPLPHDNPLFLPLIYPMGQMGQRNPYYSYARDIVS